MAVEKTTNFHLYCWTLGIGYTPRHEYDCACGP